VLRGGRSRRGRDRCAVRRLRSLRRVLEWVGQPVDALRVRNSAISSALRTGRGDVATRTPDSGPSRATRTIASQSAMWIQLTHWRPLPMRPPRPHRANPASRSRAGVLRSRTIPVRRTTARSARTSRAACSHALATPAICGGPSAGADDSSNSASPESPWIANVEACTHTGTGSVRVRAAAASANVGSTRDDLSNAILRAVGRRSTNSPARFTTAAASNSRAQPPTLRPSHAPAGADPAAASSSGPRPDRPARPAHRQAAPPRRQTRPRGQPSPHAH
jgi:hypothetical protein